MTITFQQGPPARINLRSCFALLPNHAIQYLQPRQIFTFLGICQNLSLTRQLSSVSSHCASRISIYQNLGNESAWQGGALH
jgi:hypothetical protein